MSLLDLSASFRKTFSPLDARATALFAELQQDVYRRTDRMFAVLMAVQWVAAVVITLVISPRTWEGRVHSMHPHVLAALLLGAALSGVPILLAVRRPGEAITRYTIAIAQMLWSALLIHLTGGRIETHFHVFGSLAFLAFYRDWRLLVPATIVVAGDHLLRGVFWPQSVYGVLSASPLRTLEHATWVLFEDVCLVIACIGQVRDMRAAASRQAQLEASSQALEVTAGELRATQTHLEQRVEQRTAELARQNQELESMHDQLERARDAAENANSTKSAFLANMSHEIRTPMSAIVGYADLLLDPSLDQSDRLNHVQTIRRNSEHLLSIINDILDISKIEANRLKLELIECAPAQIVSEVSSLMRVKAMTREIPLEVTFDGPIPQFIKCDPTRLRQILLNLVGNAIKFTERGSVRMVTRYVAADLSHPERGGKMCFEIHDSGVGMTSEQIGNLFQAFAQADVSTTRRFGGTGLGLAICKRLAEMLGGNIEVISVPGKGSTFTLIIAVPSIVNVPMLLNISESMFAQPVGANPASPATLQGRILLAEDGIDNQRLISLLLRKAGAHVVIVDTGVKALKAIGEAETAHEPFDLVLMDMQMPELDGYGATAKLRARGYTRPIVALTAHAMSSDREKCLLAGCDDYLSKPVSHAQLIQVAAHHIAAARMVESSSSIAPEKTSPKLKSTFAADPQMREILAEFVADLPATVAKIQTLMQSDDRLELRRIAHQLKGAGGGYGFDEITTLAAAAEKQLKENCSTDLITAAVNALVERLRTVEGYREPPASTTAEAA